MILILTPLEYHATVICRGGVDPPDSPTGEPDENESDSMGSDLMQKWIELAANPDTWPPIGVVVLAKTEHPYNLIQLLCVEELNSDYPKGCISWMVPHNIHEHIADDIEYECASNHTGTVTHWRPI